MSTEAGTRETDIVDVFYDNLDASEKSASGYFDQVSPGTSRILPQSTLAPPALRQTSTLSSPSFPDLTKLKVAANSKPSLSRSKTLPRGMEDSAVTRRNKSQDSTIVMEHGPILRMRRWILALVIVDFDLDLGPVVKGVYPPLDLLPAERENIAFSSFPDSLQFEQGTQVHSFRIRETDSISAKSEKRPSSEDGFMYGYSHFTQRRDASSKRGYQQRSLVILTHSQYPALYSALSSVLGPMFETHGIPMLETACHSIASWCDPAPGSTIELGFLGSVLQVELPRTINDQQLTETSSFLERYNPKYHILASSSPLLPPPIHFFEASLSHLWSIWECLVLCEPILIFGTSPAMTSQVVWWLRDLIRPIPLANDIRPYFTIHDQDHSSLVNKMPPKAGLLLGVTNPFFERSCSHWPHILSLGRRPQKHKSGSSPVTNIVGPSPGWKTKTHKRYISKDRQLLKQLESSLDSDEKAVVALSLQLRRHFCSRTTAFLVPLSRYLNTLIPSPAKLGAQPSNRPLRMKPFSTSDFFISLKSHGSPLPFRSTSKQREFYEHWLRSPAFGLWLANQEDVVHRVLQKDFHE